MTIRIKIFADFATPTEAKHLFEKTHRATDFPEYGPDKKIYFIGDNDEATHAIVLNWAQPDLSGFSRWNVIGFAHEPAPFLRMNTKYVENNIGIYYIGDVGNLPSPFTGGQGYILHSVPEGPIVPKNKVMSLMISQKQFAPGHKYRHQLASAILKTDLPVDIYGRGCKFYQPDPRLKGEFTNPEPMLKDYQFHICIENFESDYYFSEKVADPVCFGVTPIYMGCRNIEDFFPNMTIKLTGSLQQDMELIAKICKDPEQYILPLTLKTPDERINLISDILEGRVFPL
jgi:hypothetical protein